MGSTCSRVDSRVPAAVDARGILTTAADLERGVEVRDEVLVVAVPLLAAAHKADIAVGAVACGCCGSGPGGEERGTGVVVTPRADLGGVCLW